MTTPSSSTPLKGAQRYEREKFIGEGAWGVVFLAKDRVLDQKFAIKRFKVGDEKTKKDGVSFSAIRELKCLRELRHKNVIGLMDAYAADGALHMVLELCVGDLGDVRDPLYPLLFNIVICFLWKYI